MCWLPVSLGQESLMPSAAAINFADISLLLALAVLCLAVRWAGFLAASRTQLPPMLERMVASVPVPLLASLVASSAVQAGAAAMIAVVVAISLVLVIRNEILAALGGVAAAFLLSSI